ncbi:MAG: flagellar biosynthetic protein FliO [Pseudomonadota bacterium]
MPYDTTQWIWAGGALIAMVALLLLLGRAARLVGIAPRGACQRLRIEESLALDARRRITLVRVDGRAMVLLTGGATDLCVGWVPEAAP